MSIAKQVVQYIIFIKCWIKGWLIISWLLNPIFRIFLNSEIFIFLTDSWKINVKMALAWMWGSMLMQWLALLPPARRAWNCCSVGAFLFGVCMFSLAFSHRSGTCTGMLIVDSKLAVGVRDTTRGCLSLYVVLWRTGKPSRAYLGSRPPLRPWKCLKLMDGWMLRCILHFLWACSNIYINKQRHFNKVLCWSYWCSLLLTMKKIIIGGPSSFDYCALVSKSSSDTVLNSFTDEDFFFWKYEVF